MNPKNTRHKRRLQTFGQGNSACITNLVVVEIYLGDGLVHLVVFSAISNAGNQLGALTLCRTIAQLRTEQSLHLFKSVNVANSFGRIASLFSCKDVSIVSRVKKGTTKPWHDMPSHAAYMRAACCARGHAVWCRST